MTNVGDEAIALTEDVGRWDLANYLDKLLPFRILGAASPKICLDLISPMHLNTQAFNRDLPW